MDKTMIKAVIFVIILLTVHEQSIKLLQILLLLSLFYPFLSPFVLTFIILKSLSLSSVNSFIRLPNLSLFSKIILSPFDNL